MSGARSGVRIGGLHRSALCSAGPFYLYRVHPVAGIIELRRFEDHPDPIDRWMFLLEDL